MSDSKSEEKAAALEHLMQENHLTGESRLYRQSLRRFLTPTNDPDVLLVSANPEPSEAVVDIYGAGYIIQAESQGPGLAFTESRANEWQDPERTRIEVRLQDVLDQGGLIYPVESVITSRTWYLTMPSGSVTVRKAD